MTIKQPTGNKNFFTGLIKGEKRPVYLTVATLGATAVAALGGSAVLENRENAAKQAERAKIAKAYKQGETYVEKAAEVASYTTTPESGDSYKTFAAKVNPNVALNGPVQAAIEDFVAENDQSLTGLRNDLEATAPILPYHKETGEPLPVVVDGQVYKPPLEPITNK